MTRVHRKVVWLLLLLVVVFGCSSQTKTNTSVSGKVTYKGQPVPSGTVSFHRTGEEQSGAYGFPLKSDGTYEGSGMLPEEMVVTIETESANPKVTTPSYTRNKNDKNPMAEYDKMMREKGFKAATPTDASMYVPIPKNYAEKNTSPLKVTLTRGSNTQNFDLTD